MVCLHGAVTQSSQQRHAAEAEDCLLTQAVAGIASVERIGQALVPGRILRESRIQQIDGYRVPELALYLVTPGLYLNLPDSPACQPAQYKRLFGLLHPVTPLSNEREITLCSLSSGNRA